MSRIENVIDSACGWVLSLISWGVVMQFPAGSKVKVDTSTEQNGRDIKTGKPYALSLIENDIDGRIILTVPTGGQINAIAEVDNRQYHFQVVDWRPVGDAYLNGLGSPDLHLTVDDVTVKTVIPRVTAKLVHHKGYKRIR